MQGKKKSLQQKLDAEKDFCGGMSLSDISRKYGLALRTVKTWYQKENWKEKRAAIKRQIREANALQLVDGMTKNTVAWIECSAMITEMVAKICRRVYGQQMKSEVPPSDQDVEYAADLCGRIAKIATEIQARAMPEAQEEVLLKLLREVEELKAKTEGDIEEQLDT